MFRSVVLFFAASFLTAIASAASAESVSVTFVEGFVGRYGSSNREADNVVVFADFSAEAALVQQNSSGVAFESPTGNDIPVDLVLIVGGAEYRVPGSISWKVKQGNDLQVFGFTPDSSSPYFQTFSFPVTATPDPGDYVTLDAGSNYGFLEITESLAALGINTGDDVSGSNDMVGVLESLNSYLAYTRTLPPFGPVGTDYLTTTDTTPIVTGTATLGENEYLTVTVNGIRYTYEAGLNCVSETGTWSLEIPEGDALEP
ncbi:hypothetical protein [Ostreiculturibacter nitratireducens]|uniref:hypothetical protein n=1 Tax=Ostreiculturibacter nitratireducens TaxID=3075226 RepID=UPI0031B5DF46